MSGTGEFCLAGGRLPSVLIAAAAGCSIPRCAAISRPKPGTQDPKRSRCSTSSPVGDLLGPLVRLVMPALDFRITVLAAADCVGLLTVAQLVALPQHGPTQARKTSILQDWRVSFATVHF